MIVGALGDVWQGADAPRLAAATHVIHCAGHASPADGAHLRADIADAVRFAERFARAPRLQRFVVGTAYAHGPRRIVQEEAAAAGNDVARDEEGLPGAVLAADYLHAKAETEQRLRALGLPLVVVRPSHVVGHGARYAARAEFVLMFRLAMPRAASPRGR